MNYIQKLQELRLALEAENKRLQDKLHEIRDYCQSPKFRCNDSLDGYVNVQDIINRIDN
jgi:hypothetical protein